MCFVFSARLFRFPLFSSFSLHFMHIVDRCRTSVYVLVVVVVGVAASAVMVFGEMVTCSSHTAARGRVQQKNYFFKSKIARERVKYKVIHANDHNNRVKNGENRHINFSRKKKKTLILCVICKPK